MLIVLDLYRLPPVHSSCVDAMLVGVDLAIGFKQNGGNYEVQSLVGHHRGPIQLKLDDTRTPTLLRTNTCMNTRTEMSTARLLLKGSKIS